MDPDEDGPTGLQAINKACQDVYPEQPNPLQVTALVKYWLGGPDPLDYISMYYNHGDTPTNTPPHWHYVTCGFSDLHGDGRVHDISGEVERSGYGFELTFRLLREETDTSAPTWPAELLQSIARYVFSCENILCVGDHISWHTALDGGDSRIKHILITADPQLKPLHTKLGQVTFIQLVGVAEEELNAAQRWNCAGVLSLLRKHKITGGQWLVTHMRRGECLFDLDASTQSSVDHGITVDGSDLSGVSAVCSWEDKEGHPAPSLGGKANSPMSNDRGSMTELELTRTTVLDSVHLKFNMEAALLLPLAIRGRLKHGRHFTYKSFTGDVAITLVGRGVEGAFAGDESPLSARGPWLQVFVGERCMDKLVTGVEKLLAASDTSLPLTFELSDPNLTVSILPND